MMAVHRAAVKVVAAAGLSACTSTANRWAGTPQAAAIGFDQSLRSDPGLGAHVKFACLSGHATVILFFISAHGHPTASATPVGDRWLVTVSYPRPFAVSARYEVHRQGFGYCVSRALGN